MGQQCSAQMCCPSGRPHQLPVQELPRIQQDQQQDQISSSAPLVIEKLADVQVENVVERQRESVFSQKQSINVQEQEQVKTKEQPKINGLESLEGADVLAEEVKDVEENIVNEQKKQDWKDFYQFGTLYQKMMNLYDLSDIESAYDLVPSLKKMEESIRSQRNFTQQEFQTQLKVVQVQWQKQHENQHIFSFDRPFYLKIQELIKDLNYYTNLVADGVFQENYNKNGIKISLRREGSSVGLLIETQLNTPFENLTAFFNEIAYFTDILPFCQVASQIKEWGKNSKIGHSVLDFPVLSKRQIFFQLIGYNRLNHTGQIFGYFRSVHDKPQLQKELGVEVHPNKDYVLLVYKYFVVTYKPLRDGVGDLKLAINMEPGVKFLPNFLLEFIIKQFGKNLFKNLLAISEKFKGSKWQKSIEKDPRVPNLSKQMISDYLAKKQRK